MGLTKYFFEIFIIGRIDDTLFGDKSRDKMVRCDIKGWIINLGAVGRHIIPIPHRDNLVRRALFNRDAIAAGRAHIDCRGGGTHIKGNMIILC